MIRVSGLSKSYGRRRVVDDISFTCSAGAVTGFLGPNGAGKSTTMRMLVGLAEPTRGEATIGGRRYRDIPNPACTVGVLLDASAQHAGRTGREVLRLSALATGQPAGRADNVIEVCGLTAAEARMRIRAYSLGMRQRLGLAHALLGDPQVLILDEPANGLDPSGMHWMRGFLRRFADRGGTVLLSTHLLGEVEAIADHLVIIGDGRILADGPTADLVRRDTSLESLYLHLTATTGRDARPMKEALR